MMITDSKKYTLSDEANPPAGRERYALWVYLTGQSSSPSETYSKGYPNGYKLPEMPAIHVFSSRKDW